LPVTWDRGDGEIIQGDYVDQRHPRYAVIDTGILGPGGTDHHVVPPDQHKIGVTNLKLQSVTSNDPEGTEWLFAETDADVF